MFLRGTKRNIRGRETGPHTSDGRSWEKWCGRLRSLTLMLLLGSRRSASRGNRHLFQRFGEVRHTFLRFRNCNSPQSTRLATNLQHRSYHKQAFPYRSLCLSQSESARSDQVGLLRRGGRDLICLFFQKCIHGAFPLRDVVAVVLVQNDPHCSLGLFVEGMIHNSDRVQHRRHHHPRRAVH